MESLYTKYRPQTFADVVGQSHVVTTLERAVMEGRTSHAYLFCGPRGTGKTTMARLLAKALMCEQGEGHLPDGTCEQCRLIAAGEHPDVYELDAASRTGVDNVREEIISRVSFAPARSAYKMYIIDEVHMLTTAAFNALLKTLEEPPSHVVFVLCTTDPQKIPETILSRVQRFEFHSISNADIQQRLAYICEREGFTYDDEALELVVRHARGGMRDAISELEQLSVSGGGAITVDVARDVLGEVSASTLERMSLAMANRDVPTLFAQTESLVEVGRDLLQFTRAMAARLRDVYVVAAVGATSNIIAASDDELPAISREAKAFGSVDRIARALALLSDASTEMRIAPNQRLVLEVALTKIARPQSELTLDALADRVASLERQIVALSVPAPRQEASAQPSAHERQQVERERAQPAREAAPAQAVQQSQPASARAVQSAPPAPAARQDQAPVQNVRPAGQQPPQPPASQPSQTVRTEPSAPSQAPVEKSHRQPNMVANQAPSSAPASVSAPAQRPQAAAARTPAVSDPGELQRKWKQVVDSLLASHPQHGSLLMNSIITSDDGETLTVTLPKGSTFACKMLERVDVRSNVDPAVVAVFGHRKTRFANGGATPTAPKPQYAPARQTAPQQAVQERPAPRADEPQRAQAVGTPAESVPPSSQAQSWQQPARQAPEQKAPVQQPARQAQAPAPQPAPQAAAPQATTYTAPWEPEPVYDDDTVPYDDFDASPYEEEYAFDPILASQPPAPPAPGARMGAPTQSPAQSQAPVAAQAFSWQQPAPQAARPDPEPLNQPASQQVEQPISQSEQQVPAAPAQPPAAPDPQPTEPVPAPELSLTPEPEAAPQAEASVQPTSDAASPPQQPAPAAEAPKPRRATRKAGGIPADIVAMMAEIFGEGITYTSEPPEEEDLAVEDESDSDDTESEYLEEPTDDADYDEED
ncbi:MAG: DNA polymerase III subunit gamma/tau [Atopobiaceae bacterium]|nr:DNA polymerase III subunit gamma/tau [Atopobiaceae bacterium]